MKYTKNKHYRTRASASTATIPHKTPKNNLHPKFALFDHYTEDKRITAAGVLAKYWEQISKNWNNNTAQGYIDMYNDVILLCMDEIALEEYQSKDDYEKLMVDILSGARRGGKPSSSFSLSYKKKYRFLVKRILDIAAKNGECLNVLWGTNFAPPENIDLDKEEEKIRTQLHKSLLPAEEWTLKDLVFSDPHQSGEYMFALLMWALGGRPQEIADIQWSDIRPISADGERYVIALVTTVDESSGGPDDVDKSRTGGKTKNMFRFVPISSALRDFLLERREEVETAFTKAKEADQASGEDNAKEENNPKKIIPDKIHSVGDLHVCCAGDNFFRRCNLRKARNVCRDLLFQIGINEAIFRYFEKQMEQDMANASTTKKAESIWGKEKSVTSYLLRRHFCTILFLLGLSEDEIHYLMGHAFSETKAYLSTKRSDFRYPPFLESIWEKMALRPIFNNPPDWDAQAIHFGANHASRTQIDIPHSVVCIEESAKGGQLELRISPNEAGDPIQVTIDTITTDGAPVPVRGTYRTTQAHGNQRENVNVVNDLLRMYQVSNRARKPGSSSEDISQPESKSDHHSSDNPR